MGVTKKLALGVGIASGAILTAWLLTGDRKERTRSYLVRRTDSVKKSFKPEVVMDETEAHYYI
ncbi:MAG TPA: hypothetical protein VD884_22475 [Ohtaekwangia sp.]|nr:hypothetical protein [Ohtaekwangia sp.]